MPDQVWLSEVPVPRGIIQRIQRMQPHAGDMLAGYRYSDKGDICRTENSDHRYQG